MSSSSSEVLIDDNNDDDFNDDLKSDNDEPQTIRNELDLRKNIDYCTKSIPYIAFKPEDSPTIVSFEISNAFLPKSTLHINNFDQNDILLKIRIETQGSWKRCPKSIHISNPIYGNNFIGKHLIDKRIRSFFTIKYRPLCIYISQDYVVLPDCTPDDSKIAQLLDLGYDISESNKALQLTRNDFDQALKYLQAKTEENETNRSNFLFDEYPLFYLILEITEVFFKLSDHCCICGRHLDISGIRPMVCDDKMCNFSFIQIGVGANIISEIKRDPMANDLLISLASAAFQTKFFNPKPPDFEEFEFSRFFKTLPGMNFLANHCDNDQQLRKLLKDEKMFEILRFLILANKSHMITLNQPEIKIKECMDHTIQFLLTIASPEFEIDFQRKKKKFGSVYLWHGSPVERWYSILHNGLKDLGRTPDKVHGPMYGDGIYQSDFSNYSIHYSFSGNNLYVNSKLPKKLVILAMTENAKTKGFNKVADCEFTQKDERACIIRSLMVVKSDFNWDILSQPPEYIPTLDDVLKVISKDK